MANAEEKSSSKISGTFTSLRDDILEALMKQKLTGTEHDVVLAIVRMTYGYRRHGDSRDATNRISAGTIAKMTNRDRRDIGKVLGSLEWRGIIGIQRKNRSAPVIEFRGKEHATWRINHGSISKPSENGPPRTESPNLTGHSPQDETGNLTGHSTPDSANQLTGHSTLELTGHSPLANGPQHPRSSGPQPPTIKKKENVLKKGKKLSAEAGEPPLDSEIQISELMKHASMPLIRKGLDNICKELKDDGTFTDSFSFKNKAIKLKKNLRAIFHVLVQCKTHRPSVPWEYCTKILGIEEPNYNEAEHRKTT